MLLPSYGFISEVGETVDPLKYKGREKTLYNGFEIELYRIRSKNSK